MVMGVCDVIQCPLSPLLHTQCACFWHTGLQELEANAAN